MNLRLFGTVFLTIFLAELGDKTQLATFLYAADARNPRLTVFVGAALALIVTSALGVLLGAAVARVVNPRYLTWAAGVGFIAVGVWTLMKA